MCGDLRVVEGCIWALLKAVYSKPADCVLNYNVTITN